jgi:predicted O-methyltransferase YrrM
MTFSAILDAVKTASFAALRLAVKDRRLARAYWSESVRRYRELRGSGLPARDPLEYIYQRGWGRRSPDDRIQLPLQPLRGGGGTRVDELAVLASVTCALRPSAVFEIGTFVGRTTSVFILNAPGARVFSVDLPLDTRPEALAGDGYLETDVALVTRRRVGAFLHDAGLADRYTQILCDSRALDPSQHLGSVELAFIDGAHTAEYVRNDTEKVAAMMAERGLVFWHDYGGIGRFRDLTAYLEMLARRIEIYRVPDTTLAWAPGHQLRTLLRAA